jgi:hypothetical protein
MLTETGAESGETHNMKVIEDFETFPEITNTPPIRPTVQSYDH